jgi:hypothetical protein
MTALPSVTHGFLCMAELPEASHADCSHLVLKGGRIPESWTNTESSVVLPLLHGGPVQPYRLDSAATVNYTDS